MKWQKQAFLEGFLEKQALMLAPVIGAGFGAAFAPEGEGWSGAWKGGLRGAGFGAGAQVGSLVGLPLYKMIAEGKNATTTKKVLGLLAALAPTLGGGFLGRGIASQMVEDITNKPDERPLLQKVLI